MTRRRHEPEDEAPKAPGMDLSLPMTVKELIAIRARIIQSWKDANTAMDGVDSALRSIRDKDFHLSHESGGQRWEPGHRYDVKELTHSLDFSLYRFTLHKLNITQAMTEMARDQFLEKIKKAKTVFNETHLAGLAQNAEGLFRESSLNTVVQVYKHLIGCAYNGQAERGLKIRKKDNLQKVEQCFRVGWADVCLESNYNGGLRIASQRWRLQNASGAFRFNDLLTACRLIEGEGFSDYSNNLEAIIRGAPDSHSVDTGYFVLTAYKNRNVKVMWNEEKIHVLYKLNAIGSGKENNLPDSMRKRYKPEHFHDKGALPAEVFFQPDPKKDPNPEKDFAFFATDTIPALEVVGMAEYPTAPKGQDPVVLDTLEPSAGDGGLMRHIPAGRNVAVEFNHHRAEQIRKDFPQWEVLERDFLKWETDLRFDRVVMNPPFNNRIEAVHMIKAFGLLKPGGILVGILPDGWFLRDDQKSVVFRAWLKKHEHKAPQPLPAGSFRRTRVQTRIVCLKKPAN